MKVADHLVHRRPPRAEEGSDRRLRIRQFVIHGFVEDDPCNLLGERHTEQIDQALLARCKPTCNRDQPAARELGMLAEHLSEEIIVEPMADRVLECFSRVGLRHVEQHRDIPVEISRAKDRKDDTLRAGSANSPMDPERTTHTAVDI